jgi:hypothetical protein
MNQNEMIQKDKISTRRRYIIPAIFLLFLLVPVVVFTMLRPKFDPASEAIIRQAAAAQLGKEPNNLTDEDFAKITELSIGEMTQTIFSFSGSGNSIKYANNDISDISLLAKFTNLQKLNLGAINIPEDKLQNWMKVLSKAGIFDLEERLSLDLSPLQNLKHLEELQLGGTAVRNIKPLEGLNIKYLQLISASLSDIKPIESLKQIQKLDIIFCQNIKYKDVADLKKAIPNLQIMSTIIPNQ